MGSRFQQWEPVLLIHGAIGAASRRRGAQETAAGLPFPTNREQVRASAGQGWSCVWCQWAGIDPAGLRPGRTGTAPSGNGRRALRHWCSLCEGGLLVSRERGCDRQWRVSFWPMGRRSRRREPARLEPIAGLVTVGAAGPAGGRPRHDRRTCHFHPGAVADLGRTRPVACLGGSGG